MPRVPPGVLPHTGVRRLLCRLLEDMHVAAPVTSSRQARLQKHVERQKLLGQTSRAVHNVEPAGASLPASSQPRSQGSDTSAPSRRDFTMLASNPATALNVSRDGPHATIVKLRRQLDDTLAQNERSKTSLARSDAVILELRRDLRAARRWPRRGRCAALSSHPRDDFVDDLDSRLLIFILIAGAA